MRVEAGEGLEGGMDRREFEADGAVWLAEVTGQCMVGGLLGPAALDSIHFQCRDDAAAAIRLAYLPQGTFPGLQDEELRRLHRSAQALAPRPAPAEGARPGRVDGTR